jgi:ubiquitin thioesterase OTU1
MPPVRLRHPGGVATIQVDFESFTVQDLQQEIHAVSQILPSLQDRTFDPFHIVIPGKA